MPEPDGVVGAARHPTGGLATGWCTVANYSATVGGVTSGVSAHWDRSFDPPACLGTTWPYITPPVIGSFDSEVNARQRGRFRAFVLRSTFSVGRATSGRFSVVADRRSTPAGSSDRQPCQDCFTVTTGWLAFRSTCWVVLPKIAFPTGDRPRPPTTMNRGPILSASATISSAGSPIRPRVS